ncbi:MAG: isoprenyl transferase [Ignavibacteria bacterium]|nr:isoprenyl transferase [Ignavibacteria bacterium]MCU7522091.1 isoprenyl transferase [Ignavibacteria bacterium]MCU7525214.1 isoprenyl transferase [Ignavibacteria bacterium]
MAKEEKDLDLKAQNSLKKSGDIPEHIAIIMDGNGRWARKRGLPRAAGHKQGVETVRDIVKACVGLGVRYLTLYTFSTENWKRPKDEITTLMRLIVKSLQNETNELHANGVRLSTIGNRDSLPDVVRQELEQAVEKTSGNTKLTLNLALSYSGRWEIMEAAKKIGQMVKEGQIRSEDVTESLFSSLLTTKDIPDPDLLIRSGGEFRISNFLLWQIAYSEIFITDVLWPEFKRQHLYEAIKDYQKRERRFGLVSEQISRTSKV